MVRVPAPACFVYRLRFGVPRALWNVRFTLALVCMMRNTEPVGALDCLPVPFGQLDMVWWIILVCPSLHAIDRGTSLVCKDYGPGKRNH